MALTSRSAGCRSRRRVSWSILQAFQPSYLSAGRDFTNIIKLDPRNIAALVGRAITNFRSGDRDQAVMDYSIAKRLELPKRRYVDRKQRRFRGVGECRRSITAPASQTGGGPRAFEVDLPGGLTIGCLHLCSDYLSRGPAARRQELCAARAGGRRAIAVCSGDQFDTGPVEPRGIQRHFERSGDALGPRPSTHPNGPPFTGLKRCGFTM